MIALHVVHPDTYKVVDGSFIAGPTPEFAEREEAIIDFTTRALQHGTIIVHNNYKLPALAKLIQNAMYAMEPVFWFYHNPKTKHTNILESGGILPDEKPVFVNEESWAIATTHLCTSKKLDDLVGTATEHHVIGGYFEYCVANFAAQIAQRYASVSIIPELCAHYPHSDETQLLAVLKERNVQLLTAEEATRRHLATAELSKV